MKNIKIIENTNKIKKNLENTKLTKIDITKLKSNYITSNTKDNIFFKEKYYSELTFHYWFWKNILNKRRTIGLDFVKKEDFGLKKILTIKLI